MTTEIDAKLFPNAIIYHGDLRFPRKNDSLLTFREVRSDTIIRRAKYPIIRDNKSNADIWLKIPFARIIKKIA